MAPEQQHDDEAHAIERMEQAHRRSQAAEELRGAFALRLARLDFIVCPLRDFG
jgi:hypothetical protein